MDLSNSIQRLKALGAALDTPVGSPALPSNSPVIGFDLDGEIGGDFGAGRWTASATASAGVLVLNDPTDRDDNGIIGTRTAETSTSDPKPLIAYDHARAWLHYELKGVVKTGAKANSGRAAIIVSGEGHATAGAYLPCPRDISLAKAIQAHAKDFPLVLNAGDLGRLPTDGAAYLSAGGKLAASITLSWADLFSGPMAKLGTELASTGTIVFEAEATASVTFSLAFSDAFRIVFAGRGNKIVRVAVNRSTSSAFGLNARAAVSVGFKDPAQVREVLSSFTAQLLAPRKVLKRTQDELQRLIDIYDQAIKNIHDAVGAASDRLDQVLHKLGFERGLAQLNALQRIVDELGGLADLDARAAALASRLEDALSLDQAKAIIERILALPAEAKQRIERRLDELLDAIGLQSMLKDAHAATSKLLAKLDAIEASILDVASKRVRLGIDYEYKRLATEATLFEADLDVDHANFPSYHKALIGLDLDPLLESVMAAGKGVTLRSFLHRKELTRSWALGLSLGSLASNWSEGSTWVATRRLIPSSPGQPASEQRGLSLKGQKTYTDQYFGGMQTLNRGEFSADFNRQDASAGAWRYALNLQYERQIDKADRSWLRAMTDQAAVWRIVEPQEATQLADRLLTDYGAKDEKVRASCSLIIGHGAFANGLCVRLAGLADSDLIDSLSAALPYWDEFEIRRSVALRIEHYRTLMPLLLRIRPGESAPMQSLAEAANSVLRRHDQNLARKERSSSTPSRARPQALSAVAYRNSNVQRGLAQIRRAASNMERVLLAANDSPDSRRLLEEALRQWDTLWDDGFSLRWFGHLLQTDAMRAGAPVDSVTATLRLRIGEDTDARDVVIGAGALLV